MGVLVSCCLRLIGYDNLEGSSAQTSSCKRKQDINTKLSDRDNPAVDGRRLDAGNRGGSGSDLIFGDILGAENIASSSRSDSPGSFHAPRTWSISSETTTSSPVQPPPNISSMPKGYRDDGSKDRNKLKLNLVDSLKRSSTSTYK